MKPSVMLAIARAWHWMKHVLFNPFDLGKWCVLGFAAFLVMLGRGGGGIGTGYNLNFPSGRHVQPSDIRDVVMEAKAFLLEHLSVIVPLVSIGIVIALAIGIVLVWVSSRGYFMFLDGVVRNRGAVAEPWRMYRNHGNSMFLARLVVALLCLLVSVGIIAACVALAWPDIVALELSSHGRHALWIGIPSLTVFGFLSWLIKAVLYDLLVPIMYKRDLTVVPALAVLFKELVPGRLGSFVLFYLMMIVVNVAISVAVVLFGCITCCCGFILLAIPYVGSVIMLPLLVYDRGYSLFFLEQCGPEWQLVGLAQQQDQLSAPAVRPDTLANGQHVVDPDSSLQL